MMGTIKDILAEMRKDIPRVVDAKVILSNYADRIEEAVTNCNQPVTGCHGLNKEKTMSGSSYDKPFYVDICTSIVSIRFASNNDIIVQYDYTLQPHTLELAKDICDKMNREAEIRRPLRNCDVGTAEEQAERFEEFCLVHWGTNDTSGANCRHCPLSPFNCKLEWAQMPYDGEADK